MYNFCMELQAREQVKILLTLKHLTLTELAQMLSEKTGKKYTIDGLSRKLRQGTISYNEMLTIASILGYKIEFKELEQ